MEAMWQATLQMRQQVFAYMKFKPRVRAARWRSSPNGVEPGAHVTVHVAGMWPPCAQHVAEHMDYVPCVRNAASRVLFIKVFVGYVESANGLNAKVEVMC
jgi:hypothetical protein